MNATIDLSIVYPKLEFVKPKDVEIKDICTISGLHCERSASKLVPQSKSLIGPDRLRALHVQSGINGGKSHPGKLDIEQPKGRAAGHRLDIATSDIDKFPLGETTGSVSVTSPESDRFSVNFKITRRDGYWAIVVFTFIGLETGWFLRTSLAKKIDNLNREILAKTLLRRIRKSTRDIEDWVLQKKTASINQEIGEYLNGTEIDDDVLKQKITEWETALKNALDASETRSVEMESDINKLDNLAHGNWLAQHEISQHLNQLANDAPRIREMHRRRKLETVQLEIANVQKALHTILSDSITTWSRLVH